MSLSLLAGRTVVGVESSFFHQTLPPSIYSITVKAIYRLLIRAEKNDAGSRCERCPFHNIYLLAHIFLYINTKL